MLGKILKEMKQNFRRVKNRQEDFLHYFKANFEKHFDLNQISLDGPANPNIFAENPEAPRGFKCDSCGSGEIICKTSRRNVLFLGCDSFPGCKKAFFFSPKIRQFQELEENCPMCRAQMVG